MSSIALEPVHVAAYVEQLGTSHAAPSVKQHLAAVRMLFDWLVVGQVVRSNPASVVRGPARRLSLSRSSRPRSGPRWRGGGCGRASRRSAPPRRRTPRPSCRRRRLERQAAVASFDPAEVCRRAHDCYMAGEPLPAILDRRERELAEAIFPVALRTGPLVVERAAAAAFRRRAGQHVVTREHERVIKLETLATSACPRRDAAGRSGRAQTLYDLMVASGEPSHDLDGLSPSEPP